MCKRAIILNSKCPRAVTSSRERGPFREGQWKVYRPRLAQSAVRHSRQRLTISDARSVGSTALLLAASSARRHTTPICTNAIPESGSVISQDIAVRRCPQKSEWPRLKSKSPQREKRGGRRTTHARENSQLWQGRVGCPSKWPIEPPIPRKLRQLGESGTRRILSGDGHPLEIAAPEKKLPPAPTRRPMFSGSFSHSRASATGALSNWGNTTLITSWPLRKVAAMDLRTCAALAPAATYGNTTRCPGSLQAACSKPHRLRADG